MESSLTPFFSSFFILLREGFEAMLIAVLVFTYLDKVKARNKRPAVFWGITAGIVASMFVALGFKKIAGITHAHEELFEGGVMLVAAGMLTYVAFFCHHAKQHVEGKVDKAIATGNSFILSFTVFLAILREGFEIVLFYAALISPVTFASTIILSFSTTSPSTETSDKSIDVFSSVIELLYN